MFYLHGTKKLLDCIKPEISPPGQSDTMLGNWYVTPFLEATSRFAGVRMHPATSVDATGSSCHVDTTLPRAVGTGPEGARGRPDFITQEVWRMGNVHYAKTSNRSVVGILNEFVRQAEFWLAAYGYAKGDDDDLLAIAAKLAKTLCSPLYKDAVSPDRALHALVGRGGFM